MMLLVRMLPFISFFVEENKLYGVGRKGVYLLDHNDKWKEIISAIPEWVQNFLIHENKFYITTGKKGIFNIPIEQ